jgi:hypothetical protein
VISQPSTGLSSVGLSRTEKRCYSIRAEHDSVTGELRLKVVVLYSDGQIRPLTPRFHDESTVEAFVERWTPELAGKKVELLQMVAEKTRGNAPIYRRMQRPR